MKKYIKRLLIVILILSQLFWGKEYVSFAKQLKLNYSKITIVKGKKYKLKLNKKVKKVKWKSNNTKIVTVNSKGVIKGKKVGKTKVKAIIGKKKLSCVVKVVKQKKVKASTNTPVPTAAIVKTETAKETEIPKETEAVRTTEAPMETEAVRTTEAPVETEVVRKTETPIETEVVRKTETPMETETIIATEKPCVEVTPVCSTTPQASNASDISTVPEPDNSIVPQATMQAPETITPLVTEIPVEAQKDYDYETLEELKHSIKIQEGDIVSTGGYYENNDGGAASYIIIRDDALEATGREVIAMQYGLKAKLIMNEDTVSVKQLGAKGDGEQDDTQAINEAFNLGAKKILVPKGEYKVTDYLQLSQSNVSIIGEEGSVIFTDNDYREYDNQKKWLLYIENVKNINISSITLEARQTKRIGYAVQFGIRYASNISINDCKFIIPENVLEDENLETKQVSSYCNGTLYTGWHNVIIKNCEFVQMSDTNVGGCIGFNDIDKQNCDTAIFQDNLCKYKGHDEMIAIFGSPKSVVKNIYVKNNEMYAYPSDWSKARTMCFSVGYDDSLEVSNISFLYNQINACSDYAFMTFGNPKDVLVAYNTITFRNITEGKAPYLFKSGVATMENNICIKQNSITVNSDDNSTMGGLVLGKMKFQFNTVDYNVKSYTVFAYVEEVENNIINLRNGAEAIASGVKKFKNNKIYLEGSVQKFMLQVYQGELTSDIEIAGNQIEYQPDGAAGTFLMVNSVDMKGYEIIISNNKMISNNTFIDPILCILSINDSDKQKIEIKNNSMLEFEKIIYTASTRTDHIIEYENTIKE